MTFHEETEQQASREYSTPFRDVQMEEDVDRQREAFIVGALWVAEQQAGTEDTIRPQTQEMTMSFEEEAEQQAKQKFRTPFRSVGMELKVEKQREAFLAGVQWAIQWLRDQPDFRAGSDQDKPKQ